MSPFITRKRLVGRIRSSSRRAGGPQRLVLPVVDELDVLGHRGALGEIGADQLAEVADAEVDPVEAGGRELADDQLEDRPLADRDQRLRQNGRVRGEPGAACRRRGSRPASARGLGLGRPALDQVPVAIRWLV